MIKRTNRANLGQNWPERVGCRAVGGPVLSTTSLRPSGLKGRRQELNSCSMLGSGTQELVECPIVPNKVDLEAEFAIERRTQACKP